MSDQVAQTVTESSGGFLSNFASMDKNTIIMLVLLLAIIGCSMYFYTEFNKMKKTVNDVKDNVDVSQGGSVNDVLGPTVEANSSEIIKIRSDMQNIVGAINALNNNISSINAAMNSEKITVT